MNDAVEVHSLNPDPDDEDLDPNDTLGPYKILDRESAKTWKIARRKGKTPKIEEMNYASRLGSMMILLSEFEENDKTSAIFYHLAGLFDATLVQERHQNMSQFKGHADEIEERLCRSVARPHHRSKVIRRQGWAFLVAALGGLAALAAAQWLTSSAPPAARNAFGLAINLGQFQYLFFLFAGAALGRCVGLLISFYATIGSVSSYRALQDKLAHPVSAALNDVVLAIVAYLVFSTDLIVIAFGGGGAGNILTSSNVETNISTAIIFGLVVGIARASFLERLESVANQGVKSKD